MADKLEVHHTPKHGSWLSVLERQCLRRRLPDRAAMEREVGAWAARRNATTARIDWQFIAAVARTRLRRLYPAFED